MQSPKEMANNIFKAGAKEYVASKCQPEELSQLTAVIIHGSTFVNQRRPTQNKDPAKIPARYDYTVNQSQNLI